LYWVEFYLRENAEHQLFLAGELLLSSVLITGISGYIKDKKKEKKRRLGTYLAVFREESTNGSRAARFCGTPLSSCEIYEH
jgi:hypothetical protein